MSNSEFNISNIICISLISHNDYQLESIALTYNISFNILKKCKENGMVKVWMPKGPGYTVAEVFSNNLDDVYFYPHYLPMTAKTRKEILALQPISTPKRPKKQSVQKSNKVELVKPLKEGKVTKSKKSKVILEVDVILDKISALGMSSLTKEELDFLKNIK